MSPCLCHSGRREEDCIEAPQTAKATLTEGRKAGAFDFFAGGDVNIELKLGNAGEDLHGLGSVEWHRPYGLECKGGGEEVITHKKKT